MFEQNIQSIKDVDEKLQQSDYEQAFSLLVPDFTPHQTGSLPYAGVYQGAEGATHRTS